MVRLPCGVVKLNQDKENQSNLAGEPRTLYKVLARTFIFEKNDRVKVAACELLCNLSLSDKVNEMANQNDEDQVDESKSTPFTQDLQHLILCLK